MHVVVVTSAGDPQESNTLYAQGGIIYRGVNDSRGRVGGGHHPRRRRPL